MQHDTLHRQIFGHKAFIQALIEGFLPARGVRFDFDTLMPYKASFVSPYGKRRESDCIWRLRAGDKWHYIYLAIEFQSTNDRFMALRMMTYVGLLLFSLIESKEVKGRTRELPVVTPIVVYSGTAKWTAPTNVRALFKTVAPDLEQCLPDMKYVLLDEQRLLDHPSRNIRNIAAAFFRALNPVDMDELLATIRQMQELVKGDQELARLLSGWTISLHPDEPGYTSQAEQVWQEGADSMRARQVIDQWVQEKIQIGLVKGREEGLEQGIEQGIEQGREEGIEQGREEGLLVGEREILLRQLNRKYGPAAITPELRERIALANRAELECWSERLLDSPKVEGVFEV